MRRLLIVFLVVFLLDTPPVHSAAVPPVVGALVFTGLPIATVYQAGGVVRTANHAAVYIIFAGIPGDSPPTVASVTCTHEATDSATLKTQAVMQNYDIAPTPPLGSPVTVIGLLAGRWPPKVVKTVIDSFYRHHKLEQVTVGPMIGMPFVGKANGMSGGPVLYHGKVVATISMFGDDHLYAVPLDRQQCPAP